ncbi:hypothetical protein [Solimicrobium silvestre]|uniref:Uncharacterized protein n=1 Tax=Solimicrobium silvestre TaxID=2099400 RepID=A0A2S9GU18_9BURK|nr:hypothetical protein [Solimicrobium silvestre]PRC91199.1 hypothetical protein S2091_4094 [Solimicrobium silvestre]
MILDEEKIEEQVGEKLDAWLDRADKDIEAAVNRGLAVALLEGVSAGAKVMYEEGVPVEISTRVLTNHKRRSSDWQ